MDIRRQHVWLGKKIELQCQLRKMLRIVRFSVVYAGIYVMLNLQQHFSSITVLHVISADPAACCKPRSPTGLMRPMERPSRH